MRRLELLSDEKGEIGVFYVEGYLNSLLAEMLEEGVREKIRKGFMKFVINFEATRMINSVGISIVIGIVEDVALSGGLLAFTNLSRVNRELFEITGLSDKVRMFEQEGDALRSMSAVA